MKKSILEILEEKSGEKFLRTENDVKEPEKKKEPLKKEKKEISEKQKAHMNRMKELWVEKAKKRREEKAQKETQKEKAPDEKKEEPKKETETKPEPKKEKQTTILDDDKFLEKIDKEPKKYDVKIETDTKKGINPIFYVVGIVIVAGVVIYFLSKKGKEGTKQVEQQEEIKVKPKINPTINSFRTPRMRQKIILDGKEVEVF